VRLVSFRLSAAFGHEPGRAARLGIATGERIVPAASLADGVPGTMDGLLAGGPGAFDLLRQNWLDRGSAVQSLDIGELELLAPVPRPGKIVAVGLNYRGHAAEQNREPPDHPVLFAMFNTAVTGHGAEIRWSPRLTQAVDYEAELAVVIGRSCRRVESDSALDHVAGYTCLNDISARDLQYSDKQFVRAKSLDTFCPMGPWLVTADEIPDPQALQLRCLVSGEVMQDGSTSDMVFSVAELVSFCSQAFTLEPGDVIATGTPSGVGHARTPPEFMKPGDVMETEIEGIGMLRNTIAS